MSKVIIPTNEILLSCLPGAFCGPMKVCVPVEKKFIFIMDSDNLNL